MLFILLENLYKYIVIFRKQNIKTKTNTNKKPIHPNIHGEKLIIFWQEQTVLETTIGHKALDREFVFLMKSWVFHKQWQTLHHTKIKICLTQHQDRHRVQVRVLALVPVAEASLESMAWYVQEAEVLVEICQLII